MAKSAAPVVVVTGGTGAGKSTVAACFRKLHARVVDVDRAARVLLVPGAPAWRDVLEVFCGAHYACSDTRQAIYRPSDFRDSRGRVFSELPWVVGPCGDIRRNKLGAAVFADPKALKQLNGIMHPRLRDLLEAKIAAYQTRNSHPVVLDMAVYPERPFRGLGDVVLWVRAPGGVRAQRLVAHKRLTYAAASARVQAQWPDAAFAKVADFILPNVGSNRDLCLGAEKLWPKLLAKASGGHP